MRMLRKRCVARAARYGAADVGFESIGIDDDRPVGDARLDGAPRRRNRLRVLQAAGRVGARRSGASTDSAAKPVVARSHF